MSMWILPYKDGSKSAKELARALGIKRIKLKNSKFKPRPNKTIINWGNSQRFNEAYRQATIINKPEHIAVASNKLRSLQKLSEAGVRVPEFTTDVADAEAWEETIVARHKLTGNSGEGIELVFLGDIIPKAPLYTKYVPKKEEYRIHVMNGEVIDTQRKARKHDVADDDVNWKIRNLEGGFIFARNEDHQVPVDVLNQAVNAVAALELDFGAVDVGWNVKNEQAWVYEVNTACGLTGTTLENYVAKLEEHYA